MADLSQERQQAHAFLDQLPAAQFTAVRRLLERMVDPLSAALANAPLDDEEIKKVEGIHPPEFRLRVGDFASSSAENPPARSMCAPSKTAKTPTADRPCLPSTPGGFLSG